MNDVSSINDWDHSGVCAFNVRQSNFKFSRKYEFNMEMGYHLKPSIGLDSKYCICTKPNIKRYFQVESTELRVAQQQTKDFIIQQKQLDYKRILESVMETEYDIMNVLITA